eukprot:2045811-Heterocapsa_arctica.AAC.1
MEHLDNEIMKAEVCTSSTKRMRPDAVIERDLDLEDMHLEEQNEIMREQIATERSHAELMALGGELIRVRPRMIEASNETAVRYVRQWPDIHVVDWNFKDILEVMIGVGWIML